MSWTKRISDEPQALERLIKPETPLESTLLQQTALREGLLWGEPRFGHPEGKVGLHVREVLDNIDLINNLGALPREQLRLIAISHDAFKYQEDRGHPRDWSRHHGRLARHFMETYTSDPVVLDVIETHDDAYYAWLSTKHDHFRLENPQKSLENLLARVDYCLQVYYLFFKCDTQTGDKTQASLKWFEKNAPGIEWTRVREEA